MGGINMKRYNNLFEKIYNMDNLVLAHENAQKGKKHYKEVQMVNSNPRYYLEKLQTMLINKTFVNSQYEIFIKHGKKDRVIYKLPYFPDRILHHAIMNICEPIWKNTFIRDTYQSIKGRGVHDAVRRIKNTLKNMFHINNLYCLKLDIKKFYPSIDNTVLKQIIRKKIKCKDTLWLLDTIIDSAKSVPIGNYLSQYFGNLYLTGLDHYTKEDLKVKNYFRYCDDIVVIDTNKDRLHSIKRVIENYLNNKLNLKVKDNWQVFKITENRGIDFLGYVFYREHTKVRKDIVKSFWVKLKKPVNSVSIVNQIMSYYGWFKHSSSLNLFSNSINEKIQRMCEYHCRQENINNPIRRFKNV